MSSTTATGAATEGNYAKETYSPTTVTESDTAPSSDPLPQTAPSAALPIPFPAQTPFTIPRRMCMATYCTVLNLLLFYVIMVGLSATSPRIVLERLPRHGWSRTASRHTGSVSAVVFALFLACDKSALRSLVLAVAHACAAFCHFVIVATDVRVYADTDVASAMRREGTHVLASMMPGGVRALGTVGFVSCLVLVNERVYGRWLRDRRKRLPVLSKACVAWLLGVYGVYYIDNMIWLQQRGAEMVDWLYPALFLVMLFAGATYGVAERAAHGVATGAGSAKKEQ